MMSGARGESTPAMMTVIVLRLFSADTGPVLIMVTVAKQ